MRSKSIIFENFFVLMGYFLDIPLSVRVKTLIFRDTPKKYPTRKVFFSKIKVLYSRIKAKGGVKIGRCESKGTSTRNTGTRDATTR